MIYVSTCLVSKYYRLAFTKKKKKIYIYRYILLIKDKLKILNPFVNIYTIYQI